MSDDRSSVPPEWMAQSMPRDHNISGTKLAEAPLQELRATAGGVVCVPGDEHYDALRSPWNLQIQQFPEVIVEATGVADVLATINFARAQRLPVAIQATGHGALLPCDRSVLLSTARLKGIRIDPHRRAARVEAGVIWNEVAREAAAFGLAPLMGSSPYVGVVGYTLEGGMGWLVRKYGLAVDSVLSADLVTADGRLLTLNENSHADLFWGLRGAGGNFGVVTSLEFALYPVSEVYGGAITYPMEQAADVMLAYSQWVQTLPQEWTSTISLTHFPPLSRVPEKLRGKSVCVVRGCYLGTETEGREWLRPLRAAGTPLLDTFAQLKYRDAGSINADHIEAVHVLGQTAVLKELSGATIQTLIQVMEMAPQAPLVAAEIRHVGAGALAAVEPDRDAFGHRDLEFVMQLNAFAGSAHEAEDIRKYLRGAAEALLGPYETGEIYINFMSSEYVSAAHIRAAYSARHYQRLVALKDQYDPANMFRFNANISPSHAMQEERR